MSEKPIPNCTGQEICEGCPLKLPCENAKKNFNRVINRGNQNDIETANYLKKDATDPIRFFEVIALIASKVLQENRHGNPAPDPTNLNHGCRRVPRAPHCP